jgi:WD40 repeat protein
MNGNETSERHNLTGHLAHVISVTFSREGDFLGSLDDSGTVIVWNTKVSPVFRYWEFVILLDCTIRRGEV